MGKQKTIISTLISNKVNFKARHTTKDKRYSQW